MTPADATPEQALASAYLDGDVTAAQRAQVDASPELLATVASLRSASTRIATVAAPSETTREAGIAAALAAFDGLHSGNVVSIDSRRRWPTRVLTAAAAVLLIGVVGASVLRNNNSDDSASLAPDTKREADTGIAEDAAGNAQPVNGGDEVVLATSSSLLEIDDPQDLATLTAATPPSVATSPVADTTAGAGETSPSPARIDSYNVEALACMRDTQVFLADISYRGMIAIAVRDTVTGVTEAIDSNCTVLARVNP